MTCFTDSISVKCPPLLLSPTANASTFSMAMSDRAISFCELYTLYLATEANADAKCIFYSFSLFITLIL